MRKKPLQSDPLPTDVASVPAPRCTPALRSNVMRGCRAAFRTARRRRATVMILVLTVLGLLFVTGVAFMATMNFEAAIVGAEKGRAKADGEASRVVEEAQSLLGDITSSATGVTGVGVGATASTASSYVELPGYHNLSAPIEPSPDPYSDRMYFPWCTDAKALLSSTFSGSQMRGQATNNWYSDPIDTGRSPGWPDDPVNYPDLMYLDADGDGISDSLGFELTASTFPGVSRREFAELTRLVNAPTNPDGKVFLGLRVINHSGLVNVNASAPSLISNVLGGLAAPERHGRYSTTIEEPPLRRRFMLLPAELPPTQLLGNPFSRDAQLGLGDFASVLMKWPDSLRQPRYWPYGPQEYGRDPGKPLWQMLMDAEGVVPDDPASDSYDRRHLITTVSHDDLLARPTIVPVDDGMGNVVYRDIVDYLIEEQVKNFANPVPGKSDCYILDQFPILKYPFAENSFRVPPTSKHALQDELCACLKAGEGCTVNPRNGRMKLSLPWLKEMMTPQTGQAFGAITLFPGEDPLDPKKPAAADLLQSAFAMLLYNARGPAWSITSNAPQPNEFDFGAISATAAALTANFIDYYDLDDAPTEIQLRDAQYYKGALQSAIPLGAQINGRFTHGLERQPYITEVDVALVDGDLDSSFDLTGGYDSYAIAVELFYPQGQTLGQSLSLRVNGAVAAQQKTVVAAREFRVYYDDAGGLLPAGVTGRAEKLLYGAGALPNIVEFGGSYSIKVELLDSSSGRPVVVDTFSVTLPAMGPYRAERLVGSSLDIWLAPIPISFQVEDLTSATFDAVKDTLGRGNFPNVKSWQIHPVEAVQANTDDIATAFPTTGSLLALMRVAHDSSGVPFTAKLDLPDATLGYAIDNGRMPLFDLAKQHRLDPAASTVDELADKDYLPWGQLVFDYFTALPLANENPYRAYENNVNNNGMSPAQAFKQLERALPQVEDEGMLVHGRVNLNIAPWKVLEGLAFQPYDSFPGVGTGGVGDAVKLAVERVTDFPPVQLLAGEARPIGESLAKAIVAYRELRPLAVSGAGSLTTGDYYTQRGWDLPSQSVPQNPTMRRGMGLMTFGELANVRYPGANQTVRFDGAGVEDDLFGQSFLEAAGPLMALSEWATVRSHVFTMYGVLRGETWEDEDVALTASQQDKLNALRNADSRALRFQETVDRLPLLLGSESPRRIGDRVIGRYVDARGN